MSEAEQSIGIAIPAYRNPDRLRRCLNSIARLDRTWLAKTTVVDDSGDRSVASALSDEFENVKWIIHEQNKGFAASANRAIQESQTAFVLLLNDDVELQQDPRQRAAGLFENSKLFAVSLRSVNERGKTREGAKRLAWRGGIAKILHNPQDQEKVADGVSNTAYAVGGHAIYRRSAFIDLGGFDSLFHPFYWEDVDLSCRAKDRGLTVLYFEESAVLHSEYGAIKSTHDTLSIRRAVWRNRLLFSYRYARKLQRCLFPIGVLWHDIVSRVKRDRALQNAIADFKILRNNIVR